MSIGKQFHTLGLLHIGQATPALLYIYQGPRSQFFGSNFVTRDNIQGHALILNGPGKLTQDTGMTLIQSAEAVGLAINGQHQIQGHVLNGHFLNCELRKQDSSVKRGLSTLLFISRNGNPYFHYQALRTDERGRMKIWLNLLDSARNTSVHAHAA